MLIGEYKVPGTKNYKIGFNLNSSLSLEMPSEDLSGNSSNGARADKGIKPKKINCSFSIRYIQDELKALEELLNPPAPKELLNQDKEYVIKKLGLTEQEFEQILKAPNKTFADYPNTDSLWRRFNWFVKIARQRITRVG